MAAKKTSLSGNMRASVGIETAAGRDNKMEVTFWLSHRGGPFLIHANGKGCEPQAIDNAGYLDDFDTAIDQGFAPCPKCMK